MMANPMTAEEALAEAWATMDLNETKFAQFQAERAGRVERRGPEDSGRYEGYVIEAAEMITRLAKRGYALHPIKIDEAAVEKAARAVCNAQSERSKLYDNGDLIKDRWDFIGGKDSENGRYWLFNAREAITVYHEALVRTR